MEHTETIRDGIHRLNFLSKSEMLVKLTIDTSERNRFFVSSGDFSMTNNLVDLKIYSNTFEGKYSDPYRQT